MRLMLQVCAALLLVSSSVGLARQTGRPSTTAGAHPDQARSVVTAGESGAPLLRQLITLDLRDVPLGEALREISRQLGGRLMYDASVNALSHHVTLQREDISAGQALREILTGTGLEVVVPSGGSLILLKQAAPKRVVQDTVALRGRVVDAGSGAPVPQVVVTVGGSNQVAVTGENGLFSFARLPAGQHVLSFRRIGYQSTSLTLEVSAALDSLIVVPLSVAPISLSELVTTVSGNQMRYEVGNSIPVINAELEVQNNSYRNLSDLLAGRGNGLIALPGSGSVNSPTRLRIRGINSINMSNDPIVIIDGVRALTGYERCNDGKLRGCDNLPSRFDDLDLDDIESVEILKGPSAAAMWGSDASNGVIVIKTKRGQAGPTRWTVRYDEGFTTAPTDLRVPVQGLGTAANGTAVRTCSLADQAAGYCVPIDSVAGGFNRYAHPRTTSMALGRTRDLGVSASGGSESVQYYFSGGYRYDLGTAKMPEVDQRLVRQALGRPLDDWMVRPDAKTTTNFTGRITGRFNNKADYAITTGFVQTNSRTGGDGVMGATSDLRSVADTFELSRGWDQFYVERKYQVTRFVGSLSFNWRPTSWLSGRAVLGRDYAFTNGGEYRRRGWCLPFCTTNSRDASGAMDYSEGRRMVQTVDLGGTLRIPVYDGRVVFRTAVGAQHTRTKRQDISGSAYDLAVGRIDFNAAPAANRSVSQSSDDRATFGMYLDQSIGFNERLFVSAALRRDIGSALGREVAPLYPKWSISWLASEEPALRLYERGISLRLRGAFGHAGVQPSTTAKYRSFGQHSRYIEPDGTYGSNVAYISGIGNADLRPERSIESEGGFELGLWNDRLMIDFTYFHKLTRDAIVSRQLAPSVGLSSTARQYYNVGNVRNTGMEIFVNSRIIDRPDFTWSLALGWASRENELISLGPGVEPFSITASNIDLATVMANDGVVMPGYPLFGRWARPVLGYSDVNGDGIITANEVKLGNTLEYIGPSQPKADAFIRPEVTFWQGRIRIASDFEYVHGITQVNSYASSMRFFSASAFDPNTPLRAQACIAAASSPINNEYCFYETVNVLRLRNLSIGFTAPQSVARFFRAQAASFHILGSNLGVWSSYDGVDPMANTAEAAGNRMLGGAAVPRGTTWTLRTRLTF